MVEAEPITQLSDNQIECIAEAMIHAHGAGAARAAVARLNQCIDDGDFGGRDIWARVVQSIHERQRGPGAVAIAALCRQR